MTKPSYQGTLLIVDDMPTNLKMLFSYLSDLNILLYKFASSLDAEALKFGY